MREGLRGRLVRAGALTLRAGETYVLPSGTSAGSRSSPAGSAWRLIASRRGRNALPQALHGVGRRQVGDLESLASIILKGPVFVSDHRRDFDLVAEILKRDFSDLPHPARPARAARPILSGQRSLGSVIKLLTPSNEYTDAHNDGCGQLAAHHPAADVTVKRYYRPEWGENWRQHFTVDRIDGYQGHELKFDNQKLVGNYLRVGYDPRGSFRIFKLRPDFHPADKVQVEDDITASVVLPRESLPCLDPEYPPAASVKLVSNCEARLFQRPDDAIHRGVDRDAEADMAAPGLFCPTSSR